MFSAVFVGSRCAPRQKTLGAFTKPTRFSLFGLPAPTIHPVDPLSQQGPLPLFSWAGDRPRRGGYHIGQEIGQTPINLFHILWRGLRPEPDEGIAQLGKDAARVAIVDIDIGAAVLI